jgi:3-hydroxyisobutyrate dehydrogenase-like beta-hydroxyacid dehydrogenase
MTRVAFIGTGLLGGAMVERMLAQGQPVTVWNRTASKLEALRAAGAAVAATAGAAASAADRVHLALTDDAVVDAILAEVAPRLSSGAIVIDHSTTLPVKTKDRVARLAAGGVRFLHAPVFMSPQMCRDGKGMIMVSGPAAIFEGVQAALSQMTGDVWYLGERPELAAAYKLFGNSMLFAINAGLTDVLAMAGNIGVSGEEALALFSRFNTGMAIPMRGQKMVKQDFSPMFELAMARKDVRLMIESAGNLPLIVLPALAARMDQMSPPATGRTTSPLSRLPWYAQSPSSLAGRDCAVRLQRRQFCSHAAAGRTREPSPWRRRCHPRGVQASLFRRLCRNRPIAPEANRYTRDDGVSLSRRRGWRSDVRADSAGAGT